MIMIESWLSDVFYILLSAGFLLYLYRLNQESND